MRSLILLSLLGAALVVRAQDDLSVDDDEVVLPPTPSFAPETAEKHEFQTDVRKMLDIIINSLYTNRAVFLRELISNSADAINKVRFLYLTSPKEPKNDAGEPPALEIRVSADKENRTLTIRDGGIGMTREELVANLGRIGSSGTKAFLEKVKNAQGDMALIGQFGVGFYSAFLAADRVRVASKSDDSDTQWIWESAADGEYHTYADPRGNTLGRGTEVILHIRPDAEEFLDEGKVKEVATKYSEFIQFPIFSRTSREEERQIPDPDEEPVNETAKEDSDEDDEEAAKKKEKAKKKKKSQPKTEKVTVVEWTRVNENQPIWTRKVGDVTDEQYKEFYKALTKDYSDPLLWEHFATEGEVEFKSILFIPGTAPAKMFEATTNAISNVKLYVRRVFITDDFKDLLPRYLSFVAGVIDSDDLPLNVSREILQESRILKIIKKKLIRKVLAMFKDAAEKDAEALADYEAQVKEAADAADEEAKKELKKPEPKYHQLWKEYGRALKLGLIEDSSNRARLAKLLRFHSTKATGDTEWRSLEQYVDGMVEGQKEIYFLIGLEVKASDLAGKPNIQKFVKKGIEVLLMDSALDEYVVSHVPDYAGKKLTNLAKEDAKVPGEDSADAKKKAERRKAVNQDFLDWYKDLLGAQVEKVVLSERLVDAPAVVVSTKYGITATMQHILKSTPLGDQTKQPPPSKVLELNINHPVVRSLRERSRDAPKDESARTAARLLFETTAFESGFELDNLKDFVSRIQTTLGQSIGVESFELLEDEELPPEKEEEDEDAEVELDETEAPAPEAEAESENTDSGEAEPAASEETEEVKTDEL